MKALYTATATATDAGRNGRMRTDDGKLHLELSMPEGMGEAEKLVARAHERCPYSNATRGSIEVGIAVRGGAVTG